MVQGGSRRELGHPFGASPFPPPVYSPSGPHLCLYKGALVAQHDTLLRVPHVLGLYKVAISGPEKPLRALKIQDVLF